VAARTRALRRSQERYELAARGATTPLDWDLVTGEVFYSPRWKEALGHDDGGVGNTPEDWLDRVHPEDRPAGSPDQEPSRRRHGASCRRIPHPPRRQLPSLDAVTGIAVRDGARRRPTASRLADRHREQKRMEEQLMHLALH